MRRLVALLALSTILTGCGLRAEAVDLIPAAADRSRQPVRAAGRIAYVAAGQIWEWSDGATRPLTKPGVRYEGAAWSPDGRVRGRRQPLRHLGARRDRGQAAAADSPLESGLGSGLGLGSKGGLVSVR